jgi:hypothetical protein
MATWTFIFTLKIIEPRSSADGFWGAIVLSSFL